jgi:hypothetical protein
MFKSASADTSSAARGRLPKSYEQYGQGRHQPLSTRSSKGVVLLINAVAVLSLTVGLSNPFRRSVEPELIKELRAYFTEKLDWLDAETVELE